MSMGKEEIYLHRQLNCTYHSMYSIVTCTFLDENSLRKSTSNMSRTQDIHLDSKSCHLNVKLGDGHDHVVTSILTVV